MGAPKSIPAPPDVSPGLTDAELRASPVPVSGTLTATIAGVSTAANQVTGNASLASIDAKLTNPLPVSGTLAVTGALTNAELRATPVPVSGTVTANAGTNLNTSLLALESGGNLAAINTKLTNPFPVTTDFSKATDTPSIVSGVTGAYILGIRNDDADTRTTANQYYSPFSVDAVGRLGITDMSGSITVDAPVATPVFVRLSDGAAAITTLPVSLASVPSHAVTNAGTFAVQATLAAETTKVIGTVNQGTSPWVVSGTVTSTPSGTQTVAGNKTNNNAAPGATNVGALVAVANAAAPTQVEGNLVALRTNLAGDVAITLDSEAVVLGAGVAEIGNVKNSGTFVVQENGAALTSLQLIDDAIATAGTPPSTTKVVAIGATALTAAPSLSTGNAYALNLTTSGALRVDLGATSANATAIKVDGSAVTQPVSIAATVAVSGPLTDTQLRATPVPVSGTLALSGTVSTKTSLTANTPNGGTTGAGSTLILAANGSRKGFSITNTGTIIFSLNMSGAAGASGKGITLYPAQTFSMGEYDFTTAAVYIEADGATAYSYQEWQ